MSPLTVALVITGWTSAWLVLLDVRRLPPRSTSTASVSVIVPARNEAARLPTLLDALSTGGADIELIVVDDGSTDATAALAAAHGATVLPVEAAAGWTGKCWACWQGALASTGDILVFLDADTEPAPGFVARLAGAADHTGGLVSVQPWHRVERQYEHLSAVANLVAVLGSGTGRPTARRWWRRPTGFGPAMAVPRQAYLAAGGHGAVRADVAEDLALASRLDAGGLPVEAWAGDGISYRMYPDGVAGMVQGWSKNLAAGASATPPLRVLLVAAWITAALRAAALPLTSGWVGVAAYLVFAAQAAVLLRRVGRFGVATAVLYPLPLAAFVGFFIRSAWLRITRRPARWRGRAVQTGRP